MNCRHCGSRLDHTFLDLGFAPPSNSYLSKDDLSQPETYYPLVIMVCDQCWLVQTKDYAAADQLFTSDYAYFSSTSSTMLLHASDYSKMITDKLSLNIDSYVIEIASNDGYLLKNFVDAGIPCLGIEPTNSTAKAAEKLNIPVLREFFSESLADYLANEGRQADLIVGNNVFAHVPDINDFTKGLKKALKHGGMITLEFPHLMRLINDTQFDTVYHEHFSYLSLHAANQIFSSHGLRIFDVEELPIHGGSLRIYGCHENDLRKTKKNVKILMMEEIKHGLLEIQTYLNFQLRADTIKNNFLKFLIEKKLQKKIVLGYGAAAKGNTLINYAGIKPDLLSFICDYAPSKQGKFMPGSHIPIISKETFFQNKPDYVVILPWNISSEIYAEIKDLKKIGTRFFIASPSIRELK